MMNLDNFKLSFQDTPIKASSIKRDATWKTNILITWRWGITNDAPNLTDSIIVWSIDYKKNTISMFSIPRDLYVKFPTGWYWRINETYSRALSLNKNDKNKAMKVFESLITEITWEEIHYYIDLDFDWFIKIIDSIWWINVDVPSNLYDSTYPWKNHTYTVFSIKKWLQTLNWTTALKYARSRHTTSDFDRSIRQQLIIKWIQEKVLNLGFLTSPTKIKSLYNVIKTNINTDLDIWNIISLAIFFKDVPKDKILSSNLHDWCFYWSLTCTKWGYLYTPNRDDFNGMSVLLAEWATWIKTNNFEAIHVYTNIVFNYPLVYSENLKINIFNATKVGWLATTMAETLNKNGFNIPLKNSIWNIKDEVYEKSVILYSWTWTTKPETVSALEELFLIPSEKTTSMPKYSTDLDTKIEIIIWDDYKTLNF